MRRANLYTTSWDPKTKLVRALKDGWGDKDLFPPPLPCYTYPEANLKPQSLLAAIELVRRFTFRRAGWEEPNTVTWHDEKQLAHSFCVLQEAEGLPMEDFRGVCLTYFSSCWT